MKKLLTFAWCRRSHAQKHSADGVQMDCCQSNSEVQEEKSLTRTLVRDKKLSDYAIIVSNLHKSYDDFTAVDGIDFAVKKGTFF